jgi:menaquinone-9 beta-reductase
MKSYDAVIIGAGPAGCASALFLHRAGYQVILLDRALFPRDKVCGEFISPAADSILDDLGVLSSIEKENPERVQGVFISSYEGAELGIDYPPLEKGQKNPTSLSVPRFLLDNLFLKRLKSIGIEVLEEHSVDDFIFDSGNVAGVKVRDSENKNLELSAKVVIDAGGRNAVSLRRLNLKNNIKGEGKIAIAAHWKNIRLPQAYCYMHVGDPGYTGIAQVGRDSVNAVMIASTSKVKGQNIAEFYKNGIYKNTKRRKLLAGAELAEEPRTVESLAFSVKAPQCGGLVLVGDASGFIDPFTGEGIYLSLRSAQLAAQTLDSAFQKQDFSKNKLAEYDQARSKEFSAKFTLSRILQKVIYNRRFCDLVVKTLIKNPSLGNSLVGVIGDYYPAKQTVSFGFLMQFLRGTFLPEKRKSKANFKSLPIS